MRRQATGGPPLRGRSCWVGRCPEPGWPAGAARGGDRSAGWRRAASHASFFLFFFACMHAGRQGGQPREIAVGPPLDQPEGREDGLPLWCALCFYFFSLFPSLARPPPLRGVGKGGGLEEVLGGGGRGRGLSEAPPASPSPRPVPAREARGCVSAPLWRRSRAVHRWGRWGAAGAQAACVHRVRARSCAHTQLVGGGGRGAERTRLIHTAGSVFFNAPGCR